MSAPASVRCHGAIAPGKERSHGVTGTAMGRTMGKPTNEAMRNGTPTPDNPGSW